MKRSAAPANIDGEATEIHASQSAPPEPEDLNRLFDHMQSDELILFSTDYPHWQFDGNAALPEGMSSDLVRKIMIDNPFATYGRLKQSAIEEMTP